MKQLTILILLTLSLSGYSQEIHKKKFTTTGKTIIGVWIESEDVATVYGQMKVVLYTEKDKPFRAQIDTDGYIVYSMTRKKVGNTIRYYDNNSSFGEYYVIGEQGLKVYDSQGYIATYKKSKL